MIGMLDRPAQFCAQKVTGGSFHWFGLKQHVLQSIRLADAMGTAARQANSSTNGNESHLGSPAKAGLHCDLFQRMHVMHIGQAL